MSGARTADELLADLDVELRRLHATDPAECETTLLIHPGVLEDFFDFNDFLDVADATLDALDLGGRHPGGELSSAPTSSRMPQPDDVENSTNRSPYPMLHLLRQESIERAVAAFRRHREDLRGNIATLRRLGADGWRRLWLRLVE